MTDTRDTIRDAARDTGNAVNRALPAPQNSMTVIMLVIGAVAIVLLSLYAFGAFGSSSTTDARNDTTSESGTATPSN
ncbi:MAG: hypothetical protein ABL973_16365 [Micropepsaceae bacterium]